MESYTLNFLGIEKEFSEYESSSIIILPVPYEATVSYRSGTREGPRAILEASKYVELFDPETKKEIYKEVGIFTAPALPIDTSGPQAMLQLIEKEYRKYLYDNKLIIMLGGEHTISYAPVKIFYESGEDFSVLSIDAHADLRDTYENSKFNHACVMRRVHELVPLVEIGVRSFCKEEIEYIEKNKISVFTPQKIRESSDWITEALNDVKDNVYISIDVDGFDPSVIPSTGTPEPDGLLYFQVEELLKNIAREKNIIGIDVVELSPISSLHYSEFTIAKLIYRIINFIYS